MLIRSLTALFDAGCIRRNLTREDFGYRVRENHWWVAANDWIVGRGEMCYLIAAKASGLKP